MTVKEREDQYMTALQKANEKRLAVAAVRREVANGDLTLASALRDERSGPCEVMRLLTFAPRIGHKEALRVLRAAGALGVPIRSDKRVDQLTPHERGRIIDHLRPRYR